MNITTKNKGTSAAKKVDKKPAKYFGHDNVKDYTTPELLMALEHKASEVWMITGKEYGKNRAIGLKAIAYLTEDYSAQGLMMKKYKTNAVQRLHESVANIALELKYDGFKMPAYEKGQNCTYIMNKTMRNKNQTIEYGSFEDYDSITGIEAKNLGWFPMVEIDEPVLMKENPDKIPSEEEWDKLFSGLRSSVNRSNTRHMNVKKRDIPATKYYLTMNPWDNHPIIKRAEKYFPEEEFYKYVKEDVINNHTMQRYIKQIDTLILRGTKFGNPIIRTVEMTLRDLDIKNLQDFEDKKDLIDWEDKAYKKYYITEHYVKSHLSGIKNIPLYIQAERAILSNNKIKLAEILGLKYTDESKWIKTYDLSNVKTADTNKILNNADVISNQVIGWDIDSRVGGRFVASPVFLTYKQDLIKGVSKNIIIGEQIEIQSRGLGEQGQYLPLYQKAMLETTENLDKKIRSITRGKKTSSSVLDDNAKTYISYFLKGLPHMKHSTSKFKTSNKWKIITRQNWIQSAMDDGYLIIDEKNIGLINDLKSCVCAQGSKQRDESKVKKFDRINSVEYALYYFRGEIYGEERAGQVEDYYKTKGDKDE